MAGVVAPIERRNLPWICSSEWQ